MSTWDVKAGRVIYISYILHFVVRVQLADLNWWVVFNLSSCGLYLPLSATQPLSHSATEFWPIRIEKDTFHMLIWIIFACLSLSLLFRQSLLYDSQFNISIRTRLISTRSISNFQSQYHCFASLMECMTSSTLGAGFVRRCRMWLVVLKWDSKVV